MTRTTAAERRERQWQALLDKYGLPASVELIEQGVRGRNAKAVPMVQLELSLASCSTWSNRGSQLTERSVTQVGSECGV